MRAAQRVITIGSEPVIELRAQQKTYTHTHTQKVDPLVGSALAFDASRGSAFRSVVVDLEELRYPAQQRFLVIKLGP